MKLRIPSGAKNNLKLQTEHFKLYSDTVAASIYVTLLWDKASILVYHFNDQVYVPLALGHSNLNKFIHSTKKIHQK